MSLVPTIRFRPFSHLPGCKWLLPGTRLVYEVYPSRAYRYDIDNPEAKETILFDHQGPLEQFCVLQDLEKGKIIVSGFARTGFVRYQFAGAPLGDRERLFLGVDKSQDWQLVVRRNNLSEIVPYLFWLAQSVPTEDGDEVAMPLKELVRAAFGEHLVPRVVDTDFQGFKEPLYNGRPLALLKGIYSQVRSLFFSEEGSLFSILPNLPFISGSLANIRTTKGHTIHLEWTKGLIRRLQIVAASDDEITLHFQKEIDSFRLEKHPMTAPATLKLKKNQTYLLDHFQK